MSGVMDSALSDIMITGAKGLKKRPKERKIALILSGICMILAIAGLALNEFFFRNNSMASGFLIILVPSALTCLVSIMSYLVDDSRTFVEELAKFAEEREELNEKIKKENNVMDVIKVNLNQLNEYYTINKVQARRSYSFSITMIVTGFIVLIAGIVLCFYGKLGLNITILSSLSGLIGEFIGATSLLLYKESTKQIQLFFDKLSYLQHIMLSVELAERLDDSKKQEQISVIISSLIENKTKSLSISNKDK
ncbi:hypothetical protein DIC82_08590 [Clostridium beijerinckii]|nr:hypothetical protein DIC82_08590 [Clostridium beijerinckii]